MVESYNWLMNIIDSCKNHFQLECCQTLAELFKKMYIGIEGWERLHGNLLENMIEKDTALTV